MISYLLKPYEMYENTNFKQTKIKILCQKITQ